MKKKGKPKPQSEQEKNALWPELTDFLGLSHNLRTKGTEGSRKSEALSDEIDHDLADWERFVEAVLEKPQVSAEDIDRMSAMARDLETKMIRSLKPAFREAIKDMPRIHSGGRGRLVKEAKERQSIIEEILELRALHESWNCSEACCDDTE